MNQPNMATRPPDTAQLEWFWDTTIGGKWNSRLKQQPEYTPGPQILEPPTLDFSEPEDTNEPIQIQSPPSQPTPEQGPVQAKAYYKAQGIDYQGGRGSDYETYKSDWDPGHENPEEWWNRPNKPPPPAKVQVRTGPSAPAPQPYSPPASNYTIQSYGGVGAAGSPKTVWGASYGGLGEDPYLQAMQNIANPFKSFFTQMQLNNF